MASQAINEFVNMTGKLSIVVRDADGNIKRTICVPNLVVTTGKNYVAGRMVGAGGDPTVMSHMAIGSGVVAPAAGNSTLGTELGRVALGSWTQGVGGAANTVTGAAMFPAGVGTGAITEAGIFNDGASGVMLCRTVFPVVNKLAADSIAITWTITVV